MRTLLTALCLVCAATNGLLLVDWGRRGEAALATGAAAMGLGCIVVAILLRQLRW